MIMFITEFDLEIGDTDFLRIEMAYLFVKCISSFISRTRYTCYYVLTYYQNHKILFYGKKIKKTRTQTPQH